jgi:hypothetical protein
LMGLQQKNRPDEEWCSGDLLNFRK